MTGPELRQIRTRLHLTALQLARRLRVHQRTIYKWERGERKIHPMVAKCIARETKAPTKN